MSLRGESASSGKPTLCPARGAGAKDQQQAGFGRDQEAVLQLDVMQSDRSLEFLDIQLRSVLALLC